MTSNRGRVQHLAVNGCQAIGALLSASYMHMKAKTKANLLLIDSVWTKVLRSVKPLMQRDLGAARCPECEGECRDVARVLDCDGERSLASNSIQMRPLWAVSPVDGVVSPGEATDAWKEGRWSWKVVNLGMVL